MSSGTSRQLGIRKNGGEIMTKLFTSKKTLILILIIALAIGIFLALPGQKKPAPSSAAPLKPVKVTDDSSLKKLLLDSQVPVVEKAIGDYARTRIDGKATTVSLTSGPTVSNHGLIEFTVKTSDPKKSFVVTLDRTTYFDRIIFSVPTDNYTKTLPVYQTFTGD